MPHLAMGLLLVVACATGFAVVMAQTDERTPVLALAEPVTVGQVLAPSDLREVSVTVDAGVAVIESSQAASVVGATVAVSLPAGTVLSPAMLGETSLPERGRAVVALAVAPGAIPPEAAPGSTVLVVPLETDTEDAPNPPVADDSVAGGSVRGWEAVVVGVHPTTTEAITVVSLHVDAEDAGRIVSAGAVSVVMTAAGGE